MRAGNPRALRRVEVGNRLTIPFECLPWLDESARLEGQLLHLAPLTWAEQLRLLPPYELGAWALVDLNQRDLFDDWDISPIDILELAASDPTSRDAVRLAKLVFRCRVNPKDKKRSPSPWRLTIPVELVLAGCLPGFSENGRVWVVDEQRLLSIWRLGAWNAYATADRPTDLGA